MTNLSDSAQTPKFDLFNLPTSPTKLEIIEEWCEIKGWEGLYEVSSFGRIKKNQYVQNNKRGYSFIVPEQILSGTINDDGYIKVHLTGKYPIFVHRLVALAFIPNPENKSTINHKNGIKSDNRVENLEWATRKEQAVHARKTGLYKILIHGEQMGGSKLKEIDVIYILDNMDIGNILLANKFGVTSSLIGQIKRRKAWKYLGE